MRLVMVGVNHRAADVEVRERVAIGPAALPAALAALRRHAAEGLILSTCNRTEVYGIVGHVGSGERELRRFLAEFHGLDADTLGRSLIAADGRDAARHLCAVAAGLDSMALGEAQILGQVRAAYLAALHHGTLGPVLGALGRHALAAGKRARSETAIGRHAVTIPYAAVELARSVLGGLEGRTVLVIGAGEMAELALRSLLEYGCGSALVINRTLARARELAERRGGEALPWSALREAVARADVVISSTGAGRHVVTPELVAAGARAGRLLCLIDIAVPRDVAPSVRDLPGVALYDIDDLAATCAANSARRAAAAAAAQAIVDEEADRFMAWWRAREVVPTIQALRERAEQIREQELRRALARLPGLSERDRQVVAALASALVGKLLHQPTVYLKQSEDALGQAHIVRRLFDLPEPAADTAPLVDGALDAADREARGA